MKAVVNIGDVFKSNSGELFLVTDITTGNSYTSYWGIGSRKRNETTKKVGFLIASEHDRNVIGYHEFHVSDNSSILIKPEELEHIGSVVTKASTNREIMLTGKFWSDFYEDYISSKDLTPREGALYWIKRERLPGYHFLICSIKKPGIYVGYHIEEDGRATWSLDEFNPNDPRSKVGIIFAGIFDPVLLRWLENTRKNSLFSTFVTLDSAISLSLQDLNLVFGDKD